MDHNLIEPYKIMVRFIPIIPLFLFSTHSRFNKALTACRAATGGLLYSSREAFSYNRTSNMHLCKLSIIRFIISRICIREWVLEAQLGQTMDFSHLGSSNRLSKSQVET